MDNEFQDRFQEKKARFPGLKAKLKRTLKNIWRDRHIKAIRLRSGTHWKLLLYLDFRSYFKLLAQIDSMFSVKYFCSQYF